MHAKCIHLYYLKINNVLEISAQKQSYNDVGIYLKTTEFATGVFGVEVVFSSKHNLILHVPDFVFILSVTSVASSSSV